MKTKLLLAAMLAACLRAFAQPAAPAILTVAVFDFESKDDAVRDLGPKVAMLVNATLSADPQLITVERAELEKVLGEQEVNMSVPVEPETAVKVGHLIGAKVLITGRVFMSDNELIIVAKIISSETGRVFGELVRGVPSASIAEISSELAKRIAPTIQQHADTFTAKVESRDERMAKIRAALKGKTLPSVSVNLPERHYGAPTVDPAAETELEKILQECGFKVLDEKSAAKADVEITGEAFSAFGMRKGNLLSCKARIELKAHSRGGDLLVVDRKTSVAVDVAEQTAAKAALQNASLDIAESLLPKLAK
jgi:TolB-like protein